MQYNQFIATIESHTQQESYPIMQNNIVRIPTLSASVFPENDRKSLTEAYFEINEYPLEMASNLLSVLECIGSDEEKLAELQKMESDYDEESLLEFFNGQNLVRYLLEARANGSTDVQGMSRMLHDNFYVFEVVDEYSDVMMERIERFTEIAYDELYPLYCKPSEEIIRHFIEHCSSVAFMEVGSGNYFAYLTSAGMLLDRKIAYAYLKVDGCVPSNIMSENANLSDKKDIISKSLREFFEG